MKRLSIAVSAVSLVWACSGPTSPGGQRVTLSGTVTEMSSTGLTPVDGVRVSLTNSGVPRFVMSGADGRYSIPNLGTGSAQVQSTRSGFETDTRAVTLTGDTQLDIELVRIPPVPTFTVSGVVSEVTPTGQVPLDGVWIFCIPCVENINPLFTDANGFYIFSGLPNGVNALIVSKPGYSVVDPTRVLPDGSTEKDVTVNGDTRFDILLVRP